MSHTPLPIDPVPVDLRDGAVALGGRPVLRGVDLRVEQGELLAVLGPNGSGKSTMVKAMTGLLPLTQGELRLFGEPLGSFHDWRRVGFVPQRAGAGSGVPASVWEVVASGRLTRRGLLRPLTHADRRAIDDALETVGLAGRRRDGVSQLSGGQQQRVLIARALAGEPELLFLDEPTAGVDAANQRALADALATLKQRGATLVLVAHELGPLRPLVDRAVVMRDGRVVYDGPPTGLGAEHADGHHHDHDHDHHDTVGSTRGRHDHTPHVGSPLEHGGRHR